MAVLKLNCNLVTVTHNSLDTLPNLPIIPYMETKTKSEVEGLVKLLLVDGLPPNIKVLRVPVRKNWEDKLETEPFTMNEYQPPIPGPTNEQKKAMSLREETIQLEEIIVEGRHFLAGFAQLTYTLIVGYE